MAYKVTLEDLLEAGAHFGHQARRWNPKMGDYIYGVKEGVHIFDLAKTKEALLEALGVIEKYAKEGKTILFVGTKKQAKDKIKELGEKTGFPYVNERWMGGTLTNFAQVSKSAKKLVDLEDSLASGQFASYTKKERLLVSRDIEKLKRNFGGIVSLKAQPDLIVIIDIHRELGAAREAKRMKVPTVAVVDSNSDPTLVDWAVPMNDDAGKALDYVIALFEEAALTGQGKTVSKSETKEETKKVAKKAKAKKVAKKEVQEESK